MYRNHHRVHEEEEEEGMIAEEKITSESFQLKWKIPRTDEGTEIPIIFTVEELRRRSY